LADLRLNSNQIKEIPKEIYRCANLKRLLLMNNLIEFVSADLAKLPALLDGGLSLNGNPLKNIECLEWLKKKGNQ